MARRPGDIGAEWAENIRVVVLRGEHDVSTNRRLRIALRTAQQTGEGTVVDLVECGFIDSSSLAVLFHASQNMPVGRFAVVVAPDTEPSRLLDLVAFGQVVPIYATRDEAIRFVRAPSA
jgi:anti-anti-sigma factor